MISKDILNKAADTIISGGVIACPTESVYGFSCNPNNKEAISKILKIKNRKLNKGFILIAGDIICFEGFIEPLDNLQEDIINNSVINLNSSKQATSWLVNASDKILPEITGCFPNSGNSKENKVVIRVTKHPFLSELTKILGFPLISTSANISGNPPFSSFNDLVSNFSDEYFKQNCFVVSGDCWNLPPSCIIDIHSGKILRK